LRAALLDAGPIVGLVYHPDPHHKSTVAAIRASGAAGRRICTTWEAIGEAYTVLRTRAAASQPPQALKVLRWAWESGVTVLGTSDEDHERAGQLLTQNADLRLSYFDGLLMAVAEAREVTEVITVDGEHFRAVALAHDVAVTVA
jgi:predicted nucleic acid-binding protein